MTTEEASSVVTKAEREAKAGRVVEVESEKEARALLASGRAVVLKVHATWCGPCRAMEPIDRKIASDSADKGVIIAEVDYNKAGTLIRAYGIQGVPTYLFFKDGKEAFRRVGAMSLKEFKGRVEKLVG